MDEIKTDNTNHYLNICNCLKFIQNLFTVVKNSVPLHRSFTYKVRLNLYV
jgi:hypothetical protein